MAKDEYLELKQNFRGLTSSERSGKVFSKEKGLNQNLESTFCECPEEEEAVTPFRAGRVFQAEDIEIASPCVRKYMASGVQSTAGERLSCRPDFSKFSFQNWLRDGQKPS